MNSYITAEVDTLPPQFLTVWFVIGRDLNSAFELNALFFCIESALGFCSKDIYIK